jgi:hypothetical protein
MIVLQDGSTAIIDIRRLSMRLVLSIFALALALAPISARAHGEGAKKECHQHDQHTPHCH